MFQNKNTSNDSDNNKINLSQKNDLHVEDFPVHTMKRDLEEVKNPAAAKANAEYYEKSSVVQPPAQKNLTDTQKSSPFLDFAKEKTTQAEATAKIELPQKEIRDSRIKVVPPTIAPAKSKPLPEQKQPAQKQPVHHVNFGRVFAIILLVLVVLLGAGGIYYFWTTQQKPAEIVITSPVVQPEPVPANVSEPIEKFSKDKPNVIQIDTALITPGKTQEVFALNSYAKDIADSNATFPFEFIFTDTKNNPLTFKAFAEMLGIKLSPALSANLNGPFSLYIYNDANVTRTGLLITSKNPVKLKSLMMLEEKNLAKEILPIFLATNFTIENKAFENSDYNKLPIRYINITSPEDLSVDYTIFGQKLLIGTTKMTLRAIIDSVSSAANLPMQTP